MTDLNKTNNILLAEADQDSRLTRELVDRAQAAGFQIGGSWKWTRHFNRAGVITVRGRGLARDFEFDVGSQRLPPYRYNTGSRHHRAVLAALHYIADHYPETFATE